MATRYFPSSEADLRSLTIGTRCYYRTSSMDEQLSLKELKAIIRSLVLSTPNQLVPLSQLQRDFMNVQGHSIPITKLGFNNIFEFVCSMPDVLKVHGIGYNALVQAVPSPQNQHIHALVEGPSKAKLKGCYKSRNRGSVGPVNNRMVDSRSPFSKQNVNIPRFQQCNAIQPSQSPQKLITETVPGKRSQGLPKTVLGKEDCLPDTAQGKGDCLRDTDPGKEDSLPESVLGKGDSSPETGEKRVVTKIIMRGNRWIKCDHSNERVGSSSHCCDDMHWINFLTIPADMMGSKSTIAEQDLAPFAMRKGMILLRVLNVLNPNRIWVRFAGHQMIFDKLKYEMQQEYRSTNRDRKITEDAALPGMYCAVFWKGLWYRGKIVAPIRGTRVTVNLVDLGVIDMVELSSIQYLATVFCKPNVLAIRASLAYLVPKHNVWRRPESDLLQNMLDSCEEASAYIVDIDMENNALDVVLRGGQMANVNETFAAKALATWTGSDYTTQDIETYRRRVRTFNEKYPTFFCIEEGHVPTLSEIRQSLKRNFDFEYFYSLIPHNSEINMPEQLRLTNERIAELQQKGK